jgi:transmembrane sensor
MSEPFNPSDELLCRYLSGDCPRCTVEAVEAWLASDPDHARRLERLRTVLSTGTEQTWDVNGIWARVRSATVDAGESTRSHTAVRRARPRVAFRWPTWRLPIAASLLVGLVGGGAWLEVQRREPAPVTGEPDVVYETRRGQSATVQLSDGSRVRLAPESRLTVVGAFGDSARELSLQGEAEFQVQHDSTRPFRVRTATSVIEDIGTRFGVRAYTGEPTVTVAVAEGVVSLARRSARAPEPRPSSAVLLRVGDLGTVNTRGEVLVSRGAPTANALAWTTGQLKFANQPLPLVLATIARWYDLDIHVGDAALARHPVTAEFSTQSVDEMLQALAVAVEATIDRNGRRVVLRARQ